MEILVKNAEGNFAPRHRDYAATKLAKLEKFFRQANKVELVHRTVKSKHKIEVTVFADGHIIRGECTDADVKVGIDKIAQQLERRLTKLRTKTYQAHRKEKKNYVVPTITDSAIAEDEPRFAIAERKGITLKPMSTDEAALSMELLGHPFYVFNNRETNQTSVLYRRKDGKYGLLEPM